MKKIYIIFITSLLNLNFLNAQSTFEWLTAIDNGNTITETIDGITVTFTGTNDATSDLYINSPSGYGGSSNNVIWEITATTSVSFSFSESVDIVSILALNGNGYSNTYTFTEIEGTNLPVVVSVVDGSAPTVNLDWTAVTSFTVSTPTDNQFGFDNLVLNRSTLTTTDLALKTIKVFPNPSSDFIKLNGLTRVENYRIYSALGKEVKNGVINENEKIDIRNFTKGLYYLNFDDGVNLKFIKE